MRDKLIELIKSGGVIIPETAEAVADHLIENKVFVFPEKLNDSWELCSGFIMRMLGADEAEIEKIKEEFEFKKIKQILTDIRKYIEKGQKYPMNGDERGSLPSFLEQALADITEYAEKLGVEL